MLAAGAQSRRLAQRRRDGLPLAYAGSSAESPPALNLVLVGLGGFRGLVAEALWFRAARLQTEGRYLELVQLSDWILRLDPRASEAWAYNAWNLAYNVSVMMLRSEDRLRWINNGISLLRDLGTVYNPRDARLYRELAWIYQNKIGDDLDRDHLAYKLALAETMSPLLHPDGTLADTAENRARLAALRLDARSMRDLETRFGALDWRLAESHAVYWATRGEPWAQGTERLLCRRAVYQPLLLGVFRGRFDGSLEARRWQTAPNLSLALPAADYLDETVREHPSANMRRIQLHFLAHAMRRAQTSADPQLARALYARLQAAWPRQTPEAPSFETVIQGWTPDETP